MAATQKSLEQRQDEIAQYLLEKSLENTFLLREAEKRNIIVVGKTRSGKSTALKVLKEPFNLVVKGSMFSETVNAEISHFTVAQNPGTSREINYNIGIIDTPGLFEMTPGSGSRDIEILEALIMRCLNVEIKKINLIFFVMAHENAINVQDIQSLERFIRLFEGAENHIHLLVTKCEDLTDDEKKKVVQEYRALPGFSELIDKTTAKFHFTGGIPVINAEQGYEDLVKLQASRVVSMRSELFDTVFNANDPFDLNALKMSDDVRKRALESHQKLADLLDKSPATNPTNQPLSNPVGFKAAINQLASWIPVLAGADRKSVTAFVQRANEYIKALEDSISSPSPST